MLFLCVRTDILHATPASQRPTRAPQSNKSGHAPEPGVMCRVYQTSWAYQASNSLHETTFNPANM